MNTSDNTLQPMDEYIAKMLDKTITEQEMETLQSWAVHNGHSEIIGDYERIENGLRSLRQHEPEIPASGDFLQSVEHSIIQSMARQKSLNSAGTLSHSLFGGMNALRTGAIVIIAGLASYWAWTQFATHDQQVYDGPQKTNTSIAQQSPSVEKNNQPITIPQVTNTQVQEKRTIPTKNSASKQHNVSDNEIVPSSGMGSIQNPVSPIATELEKTKKELEEKSATASDNELMQLTMRAGILSVESGNSAMAREYLHKALTLAQKTHSMPTQGHIWGRLGMIESRANNTEKAREYYQKAVDILKPIDGNYERWESELQRLNQ